MLYDGNPGLSATPDVLWEMAQERGREFFGASPTYVDIMSKAGIVPGKQYDLSRLRGHHAGRLAGHGGVHAPGSTATSSPDLWVAPGSGGTDCCTGFVGGVADAAASTPARSRRRTSAWPRTRSTRRARASSMRSANW